MYVDFIRHFLYLNSRHNFIASPRANRSRYEKSLRNLASPILEITFTEFGARLLKILGGVFQITEHVLFKQP